MNSQAWKKRTIQCCQPLINFCGQTTSLWPRTLPPPLTNFFPHWKGMRGRRRNLATRPNLAILTLRICVWWSWVPGMKWTTKYIFKRDAVKPLNYAALNDKSTSWGHLCAKQELRQPLHHWCVTSDRSTRIWRQKRVSTDAWEIGEEFTT
jgi:hypothetical protein